MATLIVLIWVWLLTILPFTTIVTFILTIVTCSLVPNNAREDERFPQISELGTGDGHIYFLIGFVLMFIQFLLILLGRIQYLFQSQYLINRLLICLLHSIAFISSIFMLVMAIVSIDQNYQIHIIGAYGMFGCISLYCFVHTLFIGYLYLNRIDAPQHANVFYPIWFFICCLLLIAFFIVWLITADGIPEYIAAACPFLYLIGYVPQFYGQARSRKSDEALLGSVRFTNEER